MKRDSKGNLYEEEGFVDECGNPIKKEDIEYKIDELGNRVPVIKESALKRMQQKQPIQYKEEEPLPDKF